MRRLTAFTAFAVVLAFASFATSEGDDSVIDPVCQMNIRKSTAPFKDTFQGEQFWFCNQNCHKTFLENPTKYSSSVQNLRNKTYRVSGTVATGKIYANMDVPLYYKVERQGKQEVTYKPRAVELVSAEMIADLGGGKTQTTNPKISFRPMKEEGVFGGTIRLIAMGRLNLRLKITFDDGNFDEAVFAYPVLSGEEGDTGTEYDGKRMDMIIQHETMRKTGKYWVRTAQALEKGKPGLEDARKNFRLVKSYQKYYEQMVPHVFEDDLDDFKRLNAEYAKALQDMEAILAGDDAGKAMESWNSVEALHCTKCHMKYRWATFSNPESYPIRNGK
ncbi:MAG: YHS domain-containing protein [Candidatus Brocadiae bacterium]|nr:YHS domain-containing protein [Candidatus Brocadiia bacterium]